MKLSSKLLTLCVFSTNLLGSAAFIAPKAQGKKSTIPAFNYNGNFGNNDFSQQNQGQFGGQDQFGNQQQQQQYGYDNHNNPQGQVMDSRMTNPNQTLESRLSALETQTGAGVAPMPGQEYRGGAGLWDERTTLLVQGNTLKTWSYASVKVERVQVALRTEGRPLDADVELWQGPDNTPVRMRVYVENGSIRPFNAVIETPRGPNTIAVRNIGQVEFPLTACVTAEDVPRGPQGQLSQRPSSLTIQGGALKTYPFDPAVESVQVLLKTDGRPLNARLELLQGPNNNKQVIELYTEDGLDRPFYAIIETPGSGNVVRIVNTAPVEFPMSAWVEPYFVDENASSTDVVLGGDRDW